MHSRIIWQQQSRDRGNADAFALISQWWTRLNGKAVKIARRPWDDAQDLEEVDWTDQRFDETFLLHQPRIGGVTLYWQREQDPYEYHLSARKLELDIARQHLYIYVQSPQNLVVRVMMPGTFYEVVELRDPHIAGTKVGDRTILLLRDPQQHLEVKINLSPESVALLKTRLL
ncbi:MAG: hypothetical protein F6J87_21155 [Spirulina sp. SIO3F2]|nr:hypothetical protein [Spirulina sp. SIO3F2]